MSSNNVLERGRLIGSCRELRGNVLLHIFYVDLPGYRWDKTAKDKKEKEILQVVSHLEREAEKDGVKLDFTLWEHLAYESKTYPFSCASRLEFENVICQELSYHIHTDRYVVKDLKDPKFSSYQHAILFFLNFQAGRSIANMSKREHYVDYEFAVIYPSPFAFTEAIEHELLHLFGALDFYYPDRLFQLASKYFPNSIMSSGGPFCNQVDDLTRYLIGWHRTPTSRAKAVLDALEGMTLQKIMNERQSQDNTDYAVIHSIDSTYYGPMRNALYYGSGKLVYASGTVIEGTFSNGCLYGQGKATFKNGDVFTGTFNQDVGTGRLRRANGIVADAVYAIERLDLPNGDIYVGETLNGRKHGHGRLLMQDGEYCEGDFYNGLRNGRFLIRTIKGELREAQYQAGIKTWDRPYDPQN